MDNKTGIARKFGIGAKGKSIPSHVCRLRIHPKNSKFLQISKYFGTLVIDLLATKLNSKCKVSPSSRHILNIRTDAFTFRWHTYFYFYALPPLPFIPKILLSHN
nr:unnamed protein product [Callosobruchus analis]